MMLKAKRLNNLAKIVKISFTAQSTGALQAPAYHSHHCNENAPSLS